MNFVVDVLVKSSFVSSPRDARFPAAEFASWVVYVIKSRQTFFFIERHFSNFGISHCFKIFSEFKSVGFSVKTTVVAGLLSAVFGEGEKTSRTLFIFLGCWLAAGKLSVVIVLSSVEYAVSVHRKIKQRRAMQFLKLMGNMPFSLTTKIRDRRSGCVA